MGKKRRRRRRGSNFYIKIRKRKVTKKKGKKRKKNSIVNITNIQQVYKFFSWLVTFAKENLRHVKIHQSIKKAKDPI